MTRLEHHSPAEPTGQPGSINSGRPRIRIIDGCPYVLVERVDGKYREDRPHFQREDGRLWALVADVERLSTGNISRT
jgi:hypothetical protein